MLKDHGEASSKCRMPLNPIIAVVKLSLTSSPSFTAVMNNLWAHFHPKTFSSLHRRCKLTLNIKHICVYPINNFSKRKRGGNERERRKDISEVVWVKCQRFHLRDENHFLLRPDFLKTHP